MPASCCPIEVILGTLALHGGLIGDVAEGRSCLPGAIDCAGDFLIPGIVDVHTDNLERQVQPRNTARWPSRSAMVAHDAQCAGAGVTTVLDALCVGDLGFDAGRLQTYRDGVADLDALADTGLLKSEHFLHLRCELPAADMLALVEPAIDNPRLRMVSLMDHSPGVGQYANLDRYRALRRAEGVPGRPSSNAASTNCRPSARSSAPPTAAPCSPGWPGTMSRLASHDDRTDEEIEENFRDGIRISEFPVHIAAARAAQARGMQVIAGAPNIVRGGSHSGNVAATDLVHAGLVDALASDYVPASLVEAAFLVGSRIGITLPEAVALVSERPARMCGLTDRGRLAPGLRADLVRVHDARRPARGAPGLAGRRARRLMRGTRVALYYAPASDDPLYVRGAAWLGRDPQTGVAPAQPPIPDIAALTAEPRLYGFHATLKPPMHLRDSITLDDGAGNNPRHRRRHPGLRPARRSAVANLHGFLALRETAPSPALQALADAAVAGADHLRAPPDEHRTGKTPPRRTLAGTGSQPAALGLPLRLRHLDLPHDAHPPPVPGPEHATLRPAAEAGSRRPCNSGGG